MVFFNIRFNLMINEEIREMLKKIKASDPYRYESNSHVVRCALIRLYNEEVKDKNDTTLSSRKKESPIK